MELGRWRVAALAALPPAGVLVVDPGGWYPFGPLRWAAVTVVLLGGAALALGGGPVRIVRAPTVAAAALAGWMAVAAVAGLDPLYAWTGTPERHFGVLTWVLLVVALVAGQSLDPDHNGPTVAAGVVVAALGVGAVATAEALGWEPGVLDAGSRLTATLGSSAYLGAAVALFAPVAVGVALDRRLVRGLRIAAGSSLPLLAVAVMGAGARAAWVGLAAGAVALIAARRHDLRRHPARTAGAGAVVLLGVVALALVTPAGDRVAATFDADEPGGAGRLDEWRVAAHVVAARPVTGTGPEGYRIAADAEIDDAYERAHGRDPLPDRAHAAPVDVAAAGGVPALMAWLALVGFAGRAVVRALRASTPWLTGIAAALVAHLVGQLFLFPVVELEPIAWVLAGLLLAATARPGELRNAVVPRVAPAALAAAGVAALVVGAVDVRADRHARAAADALAAGDPARAVEDAAAATALRPDEVRLHLLEGRALVQADRGTLAALAAVDGALAVSPEDPVARRERVSLLVRRARATTVPAHIATATTELEAAVERAPADARARRDLGLVRGLAGDVAGAEAAWVRAELLAPRDPGPATDLALLHLGQGRVTAARAAVARALVVAPDDGRALAVAARIAEGA